MSELHLSLTAEERQCLLALLETAQKETRIEEHRTRSLTYRESVTHQEELIESVLSKLRQPA